MKYIFLALGILTLAATGRSVLVSGLHNNTTIFLAGITLALLGYGLFYDKLKKQVWLQIAVITFALVLLAFSSVLFIFGTRATTHFNEDVAIVLSTSTRDGEVLSTLARRLDAAVSFHRRNPQAVLIVSGGLGHRAEITDAEIMARYLMEHGVPSSQIILEYRAYSTYANMRYSQEILAAMGLDSAVVITSNFHMYRSVRFAEQVGIANVTRYPSTVPWYSIPLAYAREVFSVVKMWVLGR